MNETKVQTDKMESPTNESLVLFTQEEQVQGDDKCTDDESNDSLQIVGVNKERKTLVEETNGNLLITLSQYTDDMTICSWPSQALVQIIHQVHPYRDEFPMELYTKCNSQLLRRMVIDIRNDLMDTNSSESLNTKINKITGMFTMHTKIWEIFGYDREDLVDIYKEFQLAQNEVMLHEVDGMSSEEIQSLLFRGQDAMNDAEIEPINVHLVLPFSKENVLRQLQQIIVKATKEHDLDNTSMENKKLSEDEDDTLEFIKLEKDTTIATIATWSGYLLLSLLHEWHELQQEDFDEEYYMSIPSTQLRFHVVEVRNMLTKTDRIHVSIRKREVEIYSRATRDWEIEAWDSADLAIIYRRWCKCLGRKISLKKNNQMFHDLMEMNEDMFAGRAREVKFSVQLNTNFTTCNKLLTKDDKGADEEPQTTELFATLSRSTQEYNICTWCNQSLITITAKFMNLYNIVTTHDLKTTKPTILRKYLINARKFLFLSKSDQKIRSDVRNLGIFHPHIGDWEIDNMSEADMNLVLQTAETITEERKQMIANCSIIELRRMMRKFRDKTRRMGSLSGLRFQSEEGKTSDLQEITNGMYVTKDKDDTIVSMLCSLHLCGNKNNQEKENKKLDKKEDLIEEEKQNKIASEKVYESTSGRVPENTVDNAKKVLERECPNTVTPMKIMHYGIDDKNLNLDGSNKDIKHNTDGRESKRIKKDMEDNKKGQLRRSKRVEQLPEQSYVEEEALEDAITGEVLIVDSTTADWEIENMDKEAVQQTYLYCLQKRGVFYKLEDIQQFEIEHLRKEIFKARDQEIEIAVKAKEILQSDATPNSKTHMEDAEMQTKDETNDADPVVHDAHMEDLAKNQDVEDEDALWDSDKKEVGVTKSVSNRLLL